MTTTTTHTRSALALRGGPKVRTQPFPAWPIVEPRDEEAVLAALRSRKWGIGGEHTTRFEAAFARMHDAEFGLAVHSGTTALRIALLAAGVEEGDEVIVPAFTFIATASAVLECNALPVFVDIEPDTYNIDPKAVEAAITPRTRAIIPVHFAGLAADIERINAIARRHKLTVIEDAAHAHGGRYRGKGLGSIGDMGCFSFQSSKNLTGGEGGFITTNDPKLAERCRAIHNCGRLPGSAWYEHHLISGNYRMPQLVAALLLSQLERVEEQTRVRDENAAYLNERLATVPGLRPLARHREQDVHPQHLYMFRYDVEGFGGLPRAKFLEAMQAEGIPLTGGYAMPLQRQPLFIQKRFGPYTGYGHRGGEPDYAAVHTPVAQRACESECCWLHQAVLLGGRGDMDDIVRAAEKVREHQAGLRG